MRQPAAVEGFLSPTPEKEIVNQWLRQDKDDFTYQTLAILQRRGIASPWASAIGQAFDGKNVRVEHGCLKREWGYPAEDRLAEAIAPKTRALPTYCIPESCSPSRITAANMETSGSKLRNMLVCTEPMVWVAE